MLTPMSKFKSAVMGEIEVRGIKLVTRDDNKWWIILRKLKEHEGDKESFHPVTPFVNFQWW